MPQPTHAEPQSGPGESDAPWKLFNQPGFAQQLRGLGFLCGIRQSTRMATELIGEDVRHYRHCFGYTFLTLLRRQGARAYPWPFDDPSGAINIRDGNRFKLVLYTLGRVLRGDRYIGLGSLAPAVTLAALPLGGHRRVMMYAYTVGDPSDRRLYTRLKHWMLGKGLRWAGCVAWSTEVELERAVREFGLPRDRMVVFHTGVDFKYFSRRDPKQERDEQVRVMSRGKPVVFPKRSYVLAAGEMLRQDDRLLEALHNQPVHIVRTGLTDMSDRYDELRKRYPDARMRITVLHDVSSEDLRSLYQNAACFIAPTDNSWQPAGWTCLVEAMACDVPILAARGINTQEIMLVSGATSEDQACIGIWDLDNPATLVPLVQQCMAGEWDPARVQAARDLAQNVFDVDVQADRLFKSPQWKRFCGLPE